MKLAEFYELRDERRRGGFRVGFDRPVHGGLLSDMIPDSDEVPLSTEEAARLLATEIAETLPDAVNICVIQERIILGHYGKDG